MKKKKDPQMNLTFASLYPPPMKNCLALFVVFTLSILSHAQHFDWASTGNAMMNGMTHGTMTKTGTLVTAMQYSEPSYSPMNLSPTMFGGQNDSIDFGYMRSQMLIFGYNQQGGIQWHIRGEQLGYGTYVLGLASKANGNVVVAYRANGVIGRVPIDSLPAPFADDASEQAFRRDRVYGTAQSKERYQNGLTDARDAVVFTEITPTGSIVSTKCMDGFDNDDWNGFQATPDGGFIFQFLWIHNRLDSKGILRTLGEEALVKLNAKLEFSWVHFTAYKAESCCSSHYPSGSFTVAADGSIYISGNINEAMQLDGAALYTIPPSDPANGSNYESYLAQLSPQGKLIWVKYSHSRSIVQDIAVDKNGIYICGKFRMKDHVFDMKADTTGQKTAFIASMTLQGKPRWIETYRCEAVETIELDPQGHLNAVFESKSTQYHPPLIIGTDTLKNSYSHLVIANMNSQGNVRWMKSQQVFLAGSADNFTRLIFDDCGNVYVCAYMWYVLPFSYSLLDAAFVRGVGYGGAPLVARIQTSMDVIAENPELKLPEAEVELALQTKLPNSNNERNESNDAETVCKPLPAPWQIKVYPNPTNGPCQLELTCPYADDQVSVQLYNNVGGLVHTFVSNIRVEPGILLFNYNFTTESNGAYIAVVRGRNSGASARIVKTN